MGTDNGDSQAIIYKDWSQSDPLSKSSLQDNLNFIQNIEDSIELIYNTKLDVKEGNNQGTNRIVIHIRTADVYDKENKGEFYGNMIGKKLEKETGINTSVFVNNPSIYSEVDSIDGSILINLDLDGKVSYDKNIEQPTGTKKKEFDSFITIIEQELASVKKEELNEKRLIISIKSEDINVINKDNDLKTALEDIMKIETSVFINESPTVIDSKIKEAPEKTTYLVNVNLTDNGDSQAIIYKDGSEYDQFEKSSLQDNLNLIPNIKDSIELIYNTKLDIVDGSGKETNRIVLHIKTDDDSDEEERGKFYGKIIQNALEKETRIITDVFVNKPSILSVVNSVDGNILLNLELNGGNLDLVNDNLEQLSEANSKKIDSILSIIEAQVDSLNKKEKNGEALIISITSRDIEDRTKVDNLKTLLKVLTKLETSVFVNEDPSVIENVLEESDKLTYVVKVDLTDNEDSKAVIYKEGASLNKLDAELLDIIPNIKDAVGEVYNTKLGITDANDRKETSIIINIETTKGSNEE